jgi:hypothetical protein
VIVCKDGKISFLQDFYCKYKKMGKFDALHIHYVNKRKLVASRLIRHNTNQVIVTFWGSDLLGKTREELLSFEKYLTKVDKITLGSSEMSSYFNGIFSDSIRKKASVIRFGVNSLEPIYNMEDNTNRLKEKWKIPLDKKVITIGYNGSERQNHNKVIKSIINIDKLEKKDLYLLLPMTYGLTSKYLSIIEENLNQTGIEYRILKDYLNSNEIAEICSITDIFVHAQDTDAFSASVQEYLCAGTIVLNPSWISYKELIDEDVKYWEYQSYDDLKKMLQYLLTDGISDDDRQCLILNKEKMYKLSSWSLLKEKWIDLYG